MFLSINPIFVTFFPARDFAECISLFDRKVASFIQSVRDLFRNRIKNCHLLQVI